jgi:hypothetical protein
MAGGMPGPDALPWHSWDGRDDWDLNGPEPTTAAEPRPAAPGHDDDLADITAAVQCVRDDDTAGLAAIVRHGSPGGMLVTAVKLLAEAASEPGASPEHWRRWAAQAVTRP